jgi:hypothetical protein
MAWAREKYFDLVKEYQKLPFKNKIALSVGLGGAALVGAASGAVVLAGAAGAMSLTLRTLGTGATYMGLKTALERDYAKKEGEGEVISDNRKRLMLAASAVLAGLTGTAVAYAMETTGATDKIHEVVGKAGSALKGAFTHDVAPPVLHQETIGETLAKLRSSGALVEGADIDDGLGAGAPAPSYEVQKGDSLWSSVKHLLNDESKLSGLSVEEQNRVISKYISVIAEDPEKYGVTSGNPDIIRAGDHITLGGLGDEDLPEKITNWNDWKTDASPEMETPELESDGPSAQRELEEIQNMSQAPSAKVGTVIPPTEPSHSNGVSEETIQSFKAYAPQNESLIDQTKVPNAASESLEPKLGAVVEELKPAHIDLTDKQLFKELRGDSGFKKLIDSYFAPKSFGIFGTPIGEGLKSAPFHFIEIHPDMKLGEIETLAKNNNVQDIKTAWETLEKMAKETGVVLKGDKGVSTFLAEVLEKKK